ncbi:MAG: hypothetical protein KAR37_07195, partial [Alphaproteobacteria bacterium]|nr:hypothetical protein [Alphaproteobacteria bacterium]
HQIRVIEVPAEPIGRHERFHYGVDTSVVIGKFVISRTAFQVSRQGARRISVILTETSLSYFSKKFSVVPMVSCA